MNRPNKEPVLVATVVALVIAAGASYGLNVTDELRELLIYAVPVLVAAFVARSKVTPVSTSKDNASEAYSAGKKLGQGEAK